MTQYWSELYCMYAFLLQERDKEDKRSIWKVFFTKKQPENLEKSEWKKGLNLCVLYFYAISKEINSNFGANTITGKLRQ